MSLNIGETYNVIFDIIKEEVTLMRLQEKETNIAKNHSFDFRQVFKVYNTSGLPVDKFELKRGTRYTIETKNLGRLMVDFLVYSENKETLFFILYKTIKTKEFKDAYNKYKKVHSLDESDKLLNRTNLYLFMIVRNCLANYKNTYPANITEKEVQDCLEKEEVLNFDIHKLYMTSDENNLEVESYVVALIDKDTKTWCYSNVIK